MKYEVKWERYRCDQCGTVMEPLVAPSCLPDGWTVEKEYRPFVSGAAILHFCDVCSRIRATSTPNGDAP